MTQRWLNKTYKRLHSEERDVPGTRLEFSVDVAAGTDTAAKPPITWTVQRLLSDGGLDFYAKDPTLTQAITVLGSGKHRHQLTVELPAVAGLTYVVQVKVGAEKLKTLAEFTTWRRWYVDVTAANDAVLSEFRSAFPKVVEWFKRAFILVIENRVTVNGVAKETKDRSEGGIRGSSLKADLQQQGFVWRTTEVTTTWQGGEVTEGKLERKGSVLTMGLNALSEFAAMPWPGVRGTEPLLGKIWVRDANNAVVFSLEDLDDRAGAVAGAPKTMLQKVRMMETALTRVGDRELQIDLAKGDLAPAWALLQSGRKYKLELKVGYRQFGALGGDAVVAGGRKATYFLWTAEQQRTWARPQTTKMVAGLLCHEMGHLFGLAHPKLVTNYTEAKNLFTLVSGGKAAEPRAVDRQLAPNPDMHGGAHGGNGNHCFTGCELRDVHGKQVYQPIAAAPANPGTCAMYWSSQAAIGPKGFCDKCISMLQRSTSEKL